MVGVGVCILASLFSLGSRRAIQRRYRGDRADPRGARCATGCRVHRILASSILASRAASRDASRGALHGASADLEGESALGGLIVLARGGGDVGGLVIDADDVAHMAGPAHHLHSQRW